MRSGRSDPLAVLAFLLVAVGVGGMMWGRVARRAPQPCDAALDAACPDDVGAPPDASGPAPVPLPSTRQALSAEIACRNVGYLCNDLSTFERMRIQRWRGFEGTLVVHLPPLEMGDRGLGQRLRRAASTGIRAWNGQPFPILVDERGDRPAHVEVRWLPRLNGAQIGLATTSWSPQSGLKVLSLELTTQYPWGAPMDPDQLRLVAAHEMGHALGLPHSDDPRDVMFPTNTATSLSVRDYRTLEALYALEDGAEIVRSPRR